MKQSLNFSVQYSTIKKCTPLHISLTKIPKAYKAVQHMSSIMNSSSCNAMKSRAVFLLAFLALVSIQVTIAADDCQLGDTKKLDCNTCFCSNGRWACTLLGCLHMGGNLRYKQSDNINQCQRGETIDTFNCETCFCMQGQWKCIERPGCKLAGSIVSSVRNRRSAGSECLPGQTKFEQCNRCSCANGRWACTRRFCPKLKREVPTKVLADLKDVPCSPNDSFFIDCNRCQCNFERTGYVCTKSGCPQGRSTTGTARK